MQKFTVEVPTPWYLPSRATALVDVSDQRQEVGAIYLPRPKDKDRKVHLLWTGRNAQEPQENGMFRVFDVVSLKGNLGVFMFPNTWPGSMIGRVRHLVFNL